MKHTLRRTLWAGGLLICAQAVTAADQQSVAPGDMAWMKQQQRELEAFKSTLQGQQVTLPPAQQDRVNVLQQQFAAGQPEPGSPRSTPVAVYFVSFSVPPEGLKLMLADARRYGIPATLRGLIDNDFRKTASAMFDLARNDKTLGAQIDPTLYERFHITAVPALVVTCSGHYDVIRGSLPLSGALKQVAERGECAGQARALLEQTK